MKQVRIQSDGSAFDTVITTDTGEELRVSRATIWMENNELNKVDLEIVAPKVDVHANLTTITLVCPVCKETETHDCKILKSY